MNNIFINNIRKYGIKINIDKKIESKLNIDNGKIYYKNINETVINIYNIEYKNSSLYFIETINYFIIFDTLDDLLSEPIYYDNILLPQVIKSGIEFSGCISLLYIKETNIIHIDYIKSMVKCDFGELNMHFKKGTEKIFYKLFGILNKLNFIGKIILDDMATTQDGNNIKLANLRIIYKDLQELSIYQSFGFKINPEKINDAKIKKKFIMDLIDKKKLNTQKTDLMVIYKKLEDQIIPLNLYKILEDMELQFPEDIPIHIKNIMNNKLYQSAGKKSKAKKYKKTNKNKISKAKKNKKTNKNIITKIKKYSKKR